MKNVYIYGGKLHCNFECTEDDQGGHIFPYCERFTQIILPHHIVNYTKGPIVVDGCDQGFRR